MSHGITELVLGVTAPNRGNSAKPSDLELVRPNIAVSSAQEHDTFTKIATVLGSLGQDYYYKGLTALQRFVDSLRGPELSQVIERAAHSKYGLIQIPLNPESILPIYRYYARGDSVPKERVETLVPDLNDWVMAHLSNGGLPNGGYLYVQGGGVLMNVRCVPVAQDNYSLTIRDMKFS